MKKIIKKILIFFLVITSIASFNGANDLLVIKGASAYFNRQDMADGFNPLGGLSRLKKFEAQGKSVNKIDKSAPSYVEGEVLVKFKTDKINIQQYTAPENSTKKHQARITEEHFQAAVDNSSAGLAIRNFAAKYKLAQKNYLGATNSAVLKINDGQSVREKIATLKKDPNVENTQPNFQYYPAGVNPSENPLYANEWGLHNTGQTISYNEKETDITGYLAVNSSGTAGADVKAPEAWAVSDGSAHNVLVAVIDTGVAYDSPDLLPNMWDGTNCVDENGAAIIGGCPNHGWDFDADLVASTLQDNDPYPGYYTRDSSGDISYSYNSHGTHVSGIIAGADNGTGIVGLAPHAKIMAVKTADLTTDEIIKGITFAQNNGAKVINASWGDGSDDAILKSAIANFNGLFVTVSGNSGGAAIYPCADDLDNIICVAATDQNDQLTSWSNFDSTKVDVAAPGENIISAVGDFDYAYDNFDGLTVSNLPSYLTKSGGAHWQSRDVTALTVNGLSNFGASWGKVIYGDNFNPYSNNADTTLTSGVLDFSSAQKADIYFDTACDTQSRSGNNWHDYMSLEMSGDNGGTWNEVKRWDEDTLGTSGAGYNTGYYYNDSLNPNLFTNNFKYRFRWISDGSDNNYGGCLIDSLWGTEYTKGAPGFWDYYSGTSMAAPFVTGLAALLWGTKNTLTNEQVKAIILDTGDSLNSLSGKTVSGKRINALQAVSVLFNATPLTVTKLGDGNSEYKIAKGSWANLVFTKAIGTSSQDAIEVALSNGLSSGGFSGSINYFWGSDGKILTLSVSESDAIFPSNVTVDVYDIAGNENPSLLLVNSSLQTPNITNLQVGTLSKDSATIKWTTDNPSAGSVVFGTKVKTKKVKHAVIVNKKKKTITTKITTISGGRTFSDSTNNISHSLNLTGLAKNKIYYYQITAQNGTYTSQTGIMKFRTAKK